ncbi:MULTISPECIES: hypothetical protein [Methanothermococcus]|jgi:hypothetical protein|uniref:hypothetical protein n=1 Tax=Methanothermococcus TaxID=155862 RepID=UPI00038000A0|nr:MULTISPECIES: hypothetical protein [Methanothermococcus]
MHINSRKGRISDGLMWGIVTAFILIIFSLLVVPLIPDPELRYCYRVVCIVSAIFIVPLALLVGLKVR